MKTTEIFSIDGRQAVALPDGFQFGGKTISIRREGDKVILEPVRQEHWSADFFEAIRVDDAAFAKPDQGKLPLVPSFGSE